VERRKHLRNGRALRNIEVYTNGYRGIEKSHIDVLGNICNGYSF